METGEAPVLSGTSAPRRGLWARVWGSLGSLLGRLAGRLTASDVAVPRWGSRWALVCAVAAFFVHFTLTSIAVHDAFGTSGYDLGIFDQGIWLMSRFREPFVTVNGLHLLGDHASFIVIPLVPLYWVWASPHALFVVQSLALALGAVPAFLIGRQLLHSERLGLIIALAYLLHPSVEWTSVWQFHPDAVEAPLVLLAAWWMLQRRWTWFALSVALLLLVKEDMALVGIAFGLYVAWRYDRTVGLITAAASFAWLGIVWGISLPGFRGALPDAHSNRVPFGGLREMVLTTLKQPGDLARHLVSDGRPWYPFQIFVPFALLALGSPFMLVALGPFAFNMLSTHGYQHLIRYHYTPVIVSVAVVATAMTLAGVRSIRRRQFLAVLVLVLVR